MDPRISTLRSFGAEQAEGAEIGDGRWPDRHVLASTPSVRGEFVRHERDFSEYEPYVPLHFMGTDHYAK
jgi:hypothetical protein